MNLLSLVSSSLILFFASALPVTSTELTPDIFDATVQKGLWFIEHFSPYCSHCKHFKPTWEQLYAEAQTEIPEVKMATVDCIMYGDLCDKNGVKAYPTMLMFEDGKIVEHFKGAREIPILKEFMRRHIKEEPKQVTPPIQPPKPRLNINGEVLALSSDTFSSALAKGPAFVKFFAPWCGHCKKLAPVWKQFARHMQDKVTVAEVNCDDHSALCKAQGIQGYPALMWYGAGDVPGGRSEYVGGRKVEQLKAFAEKASAAGVEVLERVEDLDSQVAKSDVVYLLLHSASDTAILETIREASVPLLGSPQIFASSDPTLHARFSIPSASPWALVVIKDHDMKLPASIFYGTETSPTSDSKLRKWLLTHRLPTSLELTRDTFQSVMNAPQAPLVVIAAGRESLKAQVMERLNNVAKKWRVRTEGSGVVHGREIVFAYMDGVEWADWMKSMYGIKSAAKEGGDEQRDELEDVQVVIADHSKLVYYDSDRSGKPVQLSSSDSLFAAVADAASGKSTYKNSETFVERIARVINTRLLALETFVVEHTFAALFIAAGVIFAIVYALNYLIGNDSASLQHQAQADWKGQKGRLD